MDKLVEHAIRMLEIVEGENDFFRNDAKRQADIARAVYDTILRVQVLERKADRKTEPMTTNLEWLKTLSAEELADWFYDEWLHHLQYRWSSSRGGLIIWLKDRKTENSSEKPNNSKERSSE